MVNIQATNDFMVAFYPPLDRFTGNPYWSLLANGLIGAGYQIYDKPVVFKTSWIFKQRNQVGIIHLHYVQSLYCNRVKTKARLIYVLLFAANLILARFLGYRTVFTLHNLTPTDHLKPLWVDYLGHWVACNLVERVIVHCGEARKLLASRYGRKRQVFHVDHPNFIDQYPNTITKSKARKILNLPNNAVVFSFIGQIRPNKGIELLVSTFQNLKEKNFRLVIAGNPYQRKNYGETLRVKTRDDARISVYMSYIQDADIQIYFNASDIIVLPFNNVLTSGSTILALSFARPVIVPHMGCLPELISSNEGWLFEPASSESLANAMRAASQGDYTLAGRNGLLKIQQCTKEKFITQTLAVYLD